MKNFKCYITGEELTKANSRDEHIIQSSLGGKLKSPRLITSDLNDHFGKTIDKALAESIPLGPILGIKTDRGGKSDLGGSSDSGHNYSLLFGKQEAIRKPHRPEDFVDENGTPWKIQHGSKEFIEQLYKQKRAEYSDLSDEEFSKKCKIVPNKEELLEFYPRESFHPISGLDQCRAVAKIAANYYVFKRYNPTYLSQIVPFIELGITPLSRRVRNETMISNYYDIRLENLGVKSDEISHVIYLEGNPYEGLLFSYIELYNTYCMMILLNDRYTGKKFTDYYKQNLITNKETSTPPDLDIDYLEIRRLYFDKSEEVFQGFKNRAERTLGVKGIQLVTKQKEPT